MAGKYNKILGVVEMGRGGNYYFWETAMNVVRVIAGREPRQYVHNPVTDSFIQGIDGRQTNPVNPVTNSRFMPGVLESISG